MDKSVARRTLCAFALAASAASFQTPAAAQSFGKTEAILGGPSALQLLMAQQSGKPVTASAAPRPASYSYSGLPVVSAVLRDTPPAFSPGVLNGRPDIFGSVALRVGRTPLDARWHQVEHSPVSGTAARYAVSLRAKDSVERLEAVNWYVNKRVRFVDDQVRWGRPINAKDFFVEVSTTQKLKYLEEIYGQFHRVDGGQPWIDIRFDRITYPSGAGSDKTAQADGRR